MEDRLTLYRSQPDVMTFGSLFAGIGGFDLGFERAGMECRWHVENDTERQKILKKHWPEAGRWDDVRTFPPHPAADWMVEVLCGGFPCQDISEAGRRVGITGTRSGLWKEYVRIIRVLRPRIVVVENVSDLLRRGLDVVLGDLAGLGFDAEWSLLSSCAMGAPHARERVLLVAYADAVASGQRWREQFKAGCEAARHLCEWPGEPEPVRMADGIPDRIHRNESLGNSVMPQLTELVGRGILNIVE